MERAIWRGWNAQKDHFKLLHVIFLFIFGHFTALPFKRAQQARAFRNTVTFRLARSSCVKHYVLTPLFQKLRIGIVNRTPINESEGYSTWSFCAQLSEVVRCVTSWQSCRFDLFVHRLGGARKQLLDHQNIQTQVLLLVFRDMQSMTYLVENRSWQHSCRRFGSSWCDF